MILAGDIGGTNARLAYFQPQNGHLRLVSERVFPSREHSELGEIVSQFLDESGTRPEVACFGIAGPVRNGRVETSNLPWVIEQSRLAKQIHLPATLLINDLEASAWGIGGLHQWGSCSFKPRERHGRRQPGSHRPRNRSGRSRIVLGWNAAPRVRLRRRSYGLRSTRRSADGVAAIFTGAIWARQLRAHPVWPGVGECLRVSARQRMRERIRRTGREAENDRPCGGNFQSCACRLEVLWPKRPLDLWISVYGAEASNLALKTMATGGLFLTGGISPKILSKLSGPLFMQAFLNKGRLRPLVEAVPVQVVTNEKAGLLELARCASVRCSKS